MKHPRLNHLKHATLALVMAISGQTLFAENMDPIEWCSHAGSESARITCLEEALRNRTGQTPDLAPPSLPSSTVLAEQASSTSKAEDDVRPKTTANTTTRKSHQLVDQSDVIQSEIDGTFKGWTGKTRFKLKNGDIWQQRQQATFITSLESPKVTIKKGRFGFYTMEVPAIKRKVHVKRIR